jgi:F420-dependent oxidoreductase-like protein
VSLRIGIVVLPTGPGAVELVRQAERLGVDTVWVPEFWAGDAFTPLAYLAAHTERIRLGTAIAQLGARTPAMLAMTAQGLQLLAGDRVVLGLGVSGPQVVEGWHGVRFDRPIQRTRETVEILRSITAGERLDHHGAVYDLPLPDSQGRAIRSLLPPRHLPIFLASLGPANLRLTGEVADGWIGTGVFPETAGVFTDAIAAGAAAAGRTLADVELTVPVTLEFDEDVDAVVRRHAEGYAFTMGAMGSATTNFYNDAFARQGHGDDVAAVQSLWLAGDREAAARRVPDVFGSGTNLLGTDDLVRERLAAYEAGGIDSLRVNLSGSPETDLDAQIADLARLLDLVATVG